MLFWPVNHVTLSFTDFELEMINVNCSHDAVEILDGDNYQAPSIGGYTLDFFLYFLHTNIVRSVRKLLDFDGMSGNKNQALS